MHSEQHCAASRPEGVAHTTCINRQLSVGGAIFVSCSHAGGLRTRLRDLEGVYVLKEDPSLFGASCLS